MPSIDVSLTDAATFLVFHLPEGLFRLHTASTMRPHGLAKGARLRPKTKRKALVGYVVEEITYERGKHAPVNEVLLDLNLVEKRP